MPKHYKWRVVDQGSKPYIGWLDLPHWKMVKDLREDDYYHSNLTKPQINMMKFLAKDLWTVLKEKEVYHVSIYKKSGFRRISIQDILYRIVTKRI